VPGRGTTKQALAVVSLTGETARDLEEESEGEGTSGEEILKGEKGRIAWIGWGYDQRRKEKGPPVKESLAKVRGKELSRSRPNLVPKGGRLKTGLMKAP